MPRPKSTPPKVSPEHQLVPADYVCAALSISWAGLHKKVKAGALPAPIALGYRCHRWRLADIEAVVAGTWKPVPVEGGVK